MKMKKADWAGLFRISAHRPHRPWWQAAAFRGDLLAHLLDGPVEAVETEPGGGDTPADPGDV